MDGKGQQHNGGPDGEPGKRPWPDTTGNRDSDRHYTQARAQYPSPGRIPPGQVDAENCGHAAGRMGEDGERYGDKAVRQPSALAGFRVAREAANADRGERKGDWISHAGNPLDCLDV